MIFKENGRTLEWVWATNNKKGRKSRVLVDWDKGGVVCAFVVKNLKPNPNKDYDMAA